MDRVTDVISAPKGCLPGVWDIDGQRELEGMHVASRGHHVSLCLASGRSYECSRRVEEAHYAVVMSAILSRPSRPVCHAVAVGVQSKSVNFLRLIRAVYERSSHYLSRIVNSALQLNA